MKHILLYNMDLGTLNEPNFLQYNFDDCGRGQFPFFLNKMCSTN